MTALPLLLALCESLVAPLAHDSFAVREAAQRRLEAALVAPGGHLLVPWLEQRRDRDPEVRNRVGVALVEFYDVRPTSYHRLPWLDSNPKGPQFTRTRPRVVRYPEPADLPDGVALMSPAVSDYDYFLAEARWHVGCPGRWAEYTYATALWVQERLRQGESREAIVADLDLMAAWELEWKRKQGHPDDY